MSRSTSPSLTARVSFSILLTARQRLEPLLETAQALLQLLVLGLQLARVAREARVGLPPVDAHLLRLVDRGDEQPQLDREQLDVEQVDLDIAGDDDAFVEHALEDVGEGRALRRLGDAARSAPHRGVRSLTHHHSPSAWPRSKRRSRL